MNNYKGIYFDVDTAKYTCPKTGAHFRFDDLSLIMNIIRKDRGNPECEQLPKAQKLAVVDIKKVSEKSASYSENFIEDTIDERDIISCDKTSDGIKNALDDVRRL
jgi:hypothetical protein